MPRYWIVVAAENHARRGVAGGFVQANHGKLAPMKRMQAGDGVLIYSPVATYGGKDKLQAFTAIGDILLGEAYQGEMGGGFTAYRRNVAWRVATGAPIDPLLGKLSFTRGSTNWGQRFRFGLFEIGQADFDLIAGAMAP